MDKYIDREQAIINMETEFDMNDPYWPVHFIRYLLNLPSADVQPVVHGKWERHSEPSNLPIYFTCENCGAVGLPTFNYCPNCGARMVQDES